MDFDWSLWASEKVAKYGLQKALDATCNVRAVNAIVNAAGCTVGEPEEIGGRLHDHRGYNADLWASPVTDAQGRVVALAYKDLVYRP